MSRKDELLSIIGQAREELDKIETLEKNAESQSLVGKYFKTRNNYSCPETEKDYWWLYAKVIGTDEYGNLKTWRFQKDSGGRIIVENNLDYHMNYYTEISQKEFEIAWINLLQDVHSFSLKF